MSAVTKPIGCYKRSIPWEGEDAGSAEISEGGEEPGVTIGKTIAWIAVGVGVVAAALYAGIKLRMRYRRPRSPYESFSHAGDNGSLDLETDYGVGI